MSHPFRLWKGPSKALHACAHQKPRSGCCQHPAAACTHAACVYAARFVVSLSIEGSSTLHVYACVVDNVALGTLCGTHTVSIAAQMLTPSARGSGGGLSYILIINPPRPRVPKEIQPRRQLLAHDGGLGQNAAARAAV